MITESVREVLVASLMFMVFVKLGCVMTVTDYFLVKLGCVCDDADTRSDDDVYDMMMCTHSSCK